jgi:hypothetical protein
MNGRWRRLETALICGGILAMWGAAAEIPVLPGVPAELRYSSVCRAAELGWVEGEVTNQTQETGVASEESRFTFYLRGSMSRPELFVIASGIVPPGGTARVARARLTSVLQPGETCTFTLGAFRRI